MQIIKKFINNFKISKIPIIQLYLYYRYIFQFILWILINRITLFYIFSYTIQKNRKELHTLFIFSRYGVASVVRCTSCQVAVLWIHGRHQCSYLESGEYIFSAFPCHGVASASVVDARGVRRFLSNRSRKIRFREGVSTGREWSVEVCVACTRSKGSSRSFEQRRRRATKAVNGERRVERERERKTAWSERPQARRDDQREKENRTKERRG